MSRAVLCLTLAVLLSCRPADTDGIDRATFIAVMTDLRMAAREFPDSATFDARRRAIFETAGVTDSALSAFIARHNRDTHYMSEVWDSVDRRLNPTEALTADTTGDAR